MDYVKKLVVVNKKTNEILFACETEIDASNRLLQYVEEQNQMKYFDDNQQTMSIFDFELCNMEIGVIDSYEYAKGYLGLPDEPSGIIYGIEEHHGKPLASLSKLLTIAKAWNKQDKFTLNFSDPKQFKFSPAFGWDKKSCRFTCNSAALTNTVPQSLYCLPFYFATRARAIDFGRRFEDLFNEVLSLTP